MDRRYTLIERLFWALIFWTRFPDCMKSGGAPEGCAQLAAHQADASLGEYRKRFGRQS